MIKSTKSAKFGDNETPSQNDDEVLEIDQVPKASKKLPVMQLEIPTPTIVEQCLGCVNVNFEPLFLSLDIFQSKLLTGPNSDMKKSATTKSNEANIINDAKTIDKKVPILESVVIPVPVGLRESKRATDNSSTSMVVPPLPPVPGKDLPPVILEKPHPSINDEVIADSGSPKGKLQALPHSRVMIHQPIGGMQGQAEDLIVAHKAPDFKASTTTDNSEFIDIKIDMSVQGGKLGMRLKGIHRRPPQFPTAELLVYSFEGANSVAQRAGLLENDHIVKLNGQSYELSTEFVEDIKSSLSSSSSNKVFTLTVSKKWREKALLETNNVDTKLIPSSHLTSISLEHQQETHSDHSLFTNVEPSSPSLGKPHSRSLVTTGSGSGHNNSSVAARESKGVYHIPSSIRSDSTSHHNEENKKSLQLMDSKEEYNDNMTPAPTVSSSSHRIDSIDSLDNDSSEEPIDIVIPNDSDSMGMVMKIVDATGDLCAAVLIVYSFQDRTESLKCPAELAGMKIGDIICKVNGESKATAAELLQLMHSGNNHNNTFTVIRNNEMVKQFLNDIPSSPSPSSGNMNLKTISVACGVHDYEDLLDIVVDTSSSSLLGIKVSGTLASNFYPNAFLRVVQYDTSDSLALKSGIQIGDRILSIQGIRYMGYQGMIDSLMTAAHNPLHFLVARSCIASSDV